ncbi:hypothetical protein HZA96_06720 [Candidatus Woesearchaeota archaeon]|nr:hypothetical protein [Candidatus Woesearchaeota archaeon]
MISTIQLKQTTKQRLDSLKNKEKLQSYDQVIVHLLSSHKDVPEMFGFNRKKPIRFTREDEMKFHEL